MLRLGLALLLTSTLACGGGDDDGDGDGTGNGSADASTSADAASIDAPSSEFLGQLCPDTQCPTDATCVRQETDGPGYCSEQCGQNNVLQRPMEGDPACAAIYDQSVGTPICGMPAMSTDPEMRFLWFCVIDCSADDMCPTGFTCQDYGILPNTVFGRYCLR